VSALLPALPRRLKAAIVFGGVSINPQMLHLRGGAEIVVATPGRLLDLIDHNAIRLDAVAALVLDEADRLLDLGFAEELARILALLPARRQNLFFSATFAPAVQALAGQLLREPVRIAHRRRGRRTAPTSPSAPSRWTRPGAPSCCATCSPCTAGSARWCSWPPSTPPSRWPTSCAARA
jgi:superfamily II DNA/RNA helicase